MDSESLDTTFALLSDTRRRYVLYDLSRTNGATSLSELAERVVALETGESPTVVSDERRREVELSLAHVHLPKLADAGVVEFDGRSGDVVFVNESGTLERVLEFAGQVEDATTTCPGGSE